MFCHFSLENPFKLSERVATIFSKIHFCKVN
jgi:hypothetical protein